jgi:hypothetical protein
MDSDKPSSADNQQERPTPTSWLDEIPDDLGHYVAGFVDGEGSFNVPIRRERDRTMPLRVGLSFNVSQIGRELPELLQGVFGCGTVRERRDGVVYFEVTRPRDLLERVFPFFERFPLRGQRREISLCSEGSQHLSSQATTCRRPVSEGSSSFAAP